MNDLHLLFDYLFILYWVKYKNFYIAVITHKDCMMWYKAFLTVK